MRRFSVMLCTAALLIATTACGSHSDTSAQASASLTSGNWLLSTTSSTITTNSSGVPVRTYSILRGPLAQTGSSVYAAMVFDGGTPFSYSDPLRCYINPAPNAFSGTVDNGLTLNSTAVGNSVLTISAPVSSATTFTGTYVSTAGSFCLSGDTGTVYGIYVPPLAGSFGGTLQNFAKYPNLGVTATFSQSQSADKVGHFALSGTVSMKNYPCFTTGTIDSTRSYITGESIVLLAADTKGATVSFSQPYLPSPDIASEVDTQGFYLSGGTCGSEYVSGSGVKLVLLKQ